MCWIELVIFVLSQISLVAPAVCVVLVCSQ